MDSKNYKISGNNNTTDLKTIDFNGTLEQAIRAAKRFTKNNFGNDFFAFYNVFEDGVKIVSERLNKV